jgi:hypothetical protein
MAKQYRIDLIINASQADRAADRAAQRQRQVADECRKTAQAAQASAEQVAAANERAAMRSMVGLHKLQNAAAQFGAALKSTGQGFVALNGVIASGLKLQTNLQRQAAQQQQQQLKQQTQGMVGYHALVNSGLKLQANLQKQNAQQQKQALQQQLQGMVPVNALIQSGLNLQTKLAKQQQQAMTSNMVGLNQLRMSGIQLQDQLREAAEERDRTTREDAWAGMKAGMLTAVTAAGALAAQFWRVKESVYAAQRMVTDYREALLELAALKGQAGDTGKTMAEDLKFRAETLQTRAESDAFQQAMIGSGEASIITDAEAKADPTKKGIARSEFEKFARLAGAFQAIRKENPEVHGGLAGVIPLMMGGQVNAEQAFSEEMRLYNVFKPGGASFGSLAKQYKDIAGYVTSGVYSKEDASALLSAFSRTEGQKSGELVENFARATVGGIGRMRGMGVEGSERQGQYLEGLGVNNQMSPLEIGNRIVGDLNRRQQEAQKQGLKFSSYDYLRHHGYGNQEDIRSLMLYQGLVNSGDMSRVFLPLSQEPGDVQAGRQEIALTQRTDPVFQQRRGELAGQLANVNLGAGPQEFTRGLERMAFEQLKAKGNWFAQGDYEELRNHSVINPFGYMGMAQVRDRMGQIMAEERERVGLPSKSYPGGMGPREYYDSAVEIAGRGGDAAAGVIQELLKTGEGQLKESQRMREALEKYLNEQRQQNGQAPAHARAPLVPW